MLFVVWWFTDTDNVSFCKLTVACFIMSGFGNVIQTHYGNKPKTQGFMGTCDSQQLMVGKPDRRKWSESKPQSGLMLVLSFFFMCSGVNNRDLNTPLSLSYRTWCQICFRSPPAPTSPTWQADTWPKLCPITELLVSPCDFYFQALVHLRLHRVKLNISILARKAVLCWVWSGVMTRSPLV